MPILLKSIRVLSDFQNLFQFRITVAEIVANLLVAFLCSFFIALIYRKTYRGPGYSITFLNNLVILSMITAIVIMVIGNNLARAFGLVGAMSIIRFRTAVKDIQDIAFIFFALAVGMAAGVGLHKVAIVGTLFVSLVCYFLSKTYVASPLTKEYLLQFKAVSNGKDEHPEYLAILDKYCRHHKLINVKTDGADGSLELSYYVKLKKNKSNPDFVREIKTIQGVNHVNLYYDEDQL